MSRIEKQWFLGFYVFFKGIRGVYICIFIQSMYLIVDIDIVIHVYVYILNIYTAYT